MNNTKTKLTETPATANFEYQEKKLELASRLLELSRDAYERHLRFQEEHDSYNWRRHPFTNPQKCKHKAEISLMASKRLYAIYKEELFYMFLNK